MLRTFSRVFDAINLYSQLAIQRFLLDTRILTYSNSNALKRWRPAKSRKEYKVFVTIKTILSKIS